MLLSKLILFQTAFVLLDVNDCSNQAILIVERTPFPVDKQDWNEIVSQCSLKTLSTNDIYSNHVLFPPKKFAGTIIFSSFSSLVFFFRLSKFDDLENTNLRNF